MDTDQYGAAPGWIAYTYDTSLRLATESLNSAALAFSWDADDLLVAAGALTLTRQQNNGLLTGTTLGSVTDSYSCNEFGEMTSYTAAQNGTPVFAATYGRDVVGRIEAKSETILGASTDAAYVYDSAGRLKEVRSGGAAIAEYDYDGNGNRAAHRWAGGTNSATYDEQDRLLTYGGATYGHTASGELRTKTLAGATTTYTHDAFGNLRAVALPGGTTIEYALDAQHRRVGKTVNGTLQKGWLYADQLRIVAELDGTGTLVSRFVYASRTNVPDYMIRGSVTYRIISDHVGSVRLVVNTTDGAIVQQIDYDAFGNVTSDTNPDFQPFAFAGGLYDPDTRLTRFGARDYDPGTGRWTAKDPIGFAGGDTNLYAYVLNDPINLIDPMGTDWIETTASISAGVGDALLLGFGDELRDWTDETFGWSGGASVNECSTAYKGAYWGTTIATSVAGGGRLAYAGTAKGLSWAARAAGTEAAALRAASARDAVKVGFRLGMGGGYRIVDPAARLAKYGSADALARAVGRTSPVFNKAGAAAAASGAGAAAGGAGCGCPRASSSSNAGSARLGARWKSTTT